LKSLLQKLQVIVVQVFVGLSKDVFEIDS